MSSPPAPPPVAFRLKRPYANEDEFVRGDGPLIHRTGMVLVGAASRPAGVIVRFEVALKDGAAIFRGEGRVVAHRAAPDGSKPAGLEVKFTRLDVRGKQLVDRIVREREPVAPRPSEHLELAIESIAPPPPSVDATALLSHLDGPGRAALIPQAPPLPVIPELDEPPARSRPAATEIAPPVALAELFDEPPTEAPPAARLPTVEPSPVAPAIAHEAPVVVAEADEPPVLHEPTLVQGTLVQIDAQTISAPEPRAVAPAAVDAVEAPAPLAPAEAPADPPEPTLVPEPTEPISIAVGASVTSMADRGSLAMLRGRARSIDVAREDREGALARLRGRAR